MAFRAFALAGSRLELAFVRVGSMAVHALAELDGLLEIALGVAIRASHLRVHSQQRILRLGMIELRRQVALTIFQPLVVWQDSHVPLNAPLCGSVWQCRAGIELQPLILYGFVRPGREVALLAGHFRVQSGQRIFRLGMVELVRLFPVDDIVATCAIRAELPLVRVLVAADAIL